MTASRFQVLVVGGGPAGCATGITLARLGVSVLVVDRSTAHPIVGESLPPAASTQLRALGVWEQFIQDGHLLSYGNRSSWGRAEIDEYDFMRSPYGMGYHLDRDRFNDMMRAGVRAAGGTLQEHSRMVACRRGDGGGWVCTLSTDQTLREVAADYVVDATGRARSFAHMQGVKRRVYDHLVGAIGILPAGREDGESDTFALVEAVRDGWWFANELPDGRLVVGYMTDADLARDNRVRTIGGWKARVGETVHIRAMMERKEFTLAELPRLVSADSSKLEPMMGAGWCAVGDAAGGYDPLSSQGILKALASGVLAGKAIAAPGSDGLAQFEDTTAHGYAGYRARWMAYYAQEQRWPDSPFWQRRHTTLDRLLRGTA